MASPEQLARRLAAVPAAQACQIAFGVPASVTLAQWELESSWGASGLAEEANNFFGVKAENLDDPNSYREFSTHEFIKGVDTIVKAKFEKYPDVEASFRDHARLLSQASRYAPAMAVKSDPFAFANELQTCGYSTSPTYGKSLSDIIRGSNLQQYDKIGA